MWIRISHPRHSVAVTVKIHEGSPEGIRMTMEERICERDEFLPARRYASAGNRDRNVSVCPSVRLSVRLSVCHAPVLCQNEES